MGFVLWGRDLVPVVYIRKVPLFTVFFFGRKVLKDTRNWPRLIGVRMTRVSLRTGSTLYFSPSQCLQHLKIARKGVMLLSLAA